MSELENIKWIYRTLIPKFIRNTAFVEALKRKLLPHNMVYDEKYYERDVEGPAARSAPAIVESLLREFRPSSVLDVGCGTGAMLAAFAARGCRAKGLEYADAGIRMCQQRGLDVLKFDIEKDRLPPGASYDLIISMEVAEHLPESIAGNYVELLTSAAPCVAMTAATPGQGGTDHVNEQPNAYWMAKFADRGFRFDQELTDRLRSEWAANATVQTWYHHNLLIFHR